MIPHFGLSKLLSSYDTISKQAGKCGSLRKYTTLLHIMKFIDITKFIETANYIGFFGILTGSVAPDVYSKRVKKSWQTPLSEKKKQELSSWFQPFEKDCLRLGLDNSAKTVSSILGILQTSNHNYGELGELFQELVGRLKDEIESRKFFSVEIDKQSFFKDNNLFGKDVTEAFPSAIIDIKEAGKCLAFERWTACVFHLMRVMEIGLKVICKYLKTTKVTDTKNKSWGFILRQCEECLKQPEWKNNHFIAEIVAMLHSVKDAWRNPTMHVERTYTEEQAQDIWNVVKGFMRHLATKLKEDTAN